eukprot:TRINITY_DN20482_c0_g1_i1.p2 TRINITY_DN20482_c0_g1~~TRINITY_DN20482_c0_g1_i1.p2  ORF type:complete len:171 (-),score=26.55 TRINITY_DN20482_c0_g1_i1:21-533(-)
MSTLRLLELRLEAGLRLEPEFKSDVFQYDVHLPSDRYDTSVFVRWPRTPQEALANGIPESGIIHRAEICMVNSRIPDIANGGTYRTEVLPHGTQHIAVVLYDQSRDFKSRGSYTISFHREKHTAAPCAHPAFYETSEDVFGGACGSSSERFGHYCGLCGARIGERWERYD